MSNFKKLVPALALVVALSPFAANAVTTQGPAHKSGYLSGTAISQFAANSKGRPGENSPATSQVADNSKARAVEFPPANNQIAVNSKGRPGENSPAANQVADNSKGRPGDFPPAAAPETPFG
jgi:hypothetical protein